MVIAFELEPNISVSRMKRVFRITMKAADRIVKALRPFPRNQFAYKTDQYRPFEDFRDIPAYLEQPGIVFLPHRFEEHLDQLLEPAGRPMRRPSYIT